MRRRKRMLEEQPGIKIRSRQMPRFKPGGRSDDRFFRFSP